MSILEDIEIIIQQLQQTLSQKPSDISKELSQIQEIQILQQKVQTQSNLLERSILVLQSAQGQIQSIRIKYNECQIELDTKKKQLHIASENIERLNEKVTHYENQEDHLKQQITHLQAAIAQRERQIERRQQKYNGQLTSQREQNMALQQYIENICVKYRNLEIIVEQQAKKRDQLQQKVQYYQENQMDFRKEISQIQANLRQISQEREKILQQLNEKNEKIFKMKESYNRDKQANYEEEQQNEYSRNNFDNIRQNQQEEQVSTQIKLIQLSSHFADHEKGFINLEDYQQHPFFDRQKSIRKSSKDNEQKSNKIFLPKEKKQQDNYRTLRRVVSDHELASDKKPRILKINIQAQKAIPKDNHDNISKQSSPSKQSNPIFHQINTRVENKLRDYYNIHTDKVIIQTQGTDREDTERSFKNDELKVSHSADPYYIHYLLTVQSIKIQQDEQGIYGILEVDMKPYYQQLVSSKLSLSKWKQWIRNKLVTLSTEEGYSEQE